MKFHFTALEFVIQWVCLCPRRSSVVNCVEGNPAPNTLFFLLDIKRFSLWYIHLNLSSGNVLPLWMVIWPTLWYFSIKMDNYSFESCSLLVVFHNITNNGFALLPITGKSEQAIQARWKIYTHWAVRYIQYVCSTLPLCCYYYRMIISFYSCLS